MGFITEAVGSYLGFDYAILLNPLGLRWFYIDVPITDTDLEIRSDITTHECECVQIVTVSNADIHYLRLYFSIGSPIYCLPDIASLMVIYNAQRRQIIEALSFVDEIIKETSEYTDCKPEVLDYDKALEICQRAIVDIFSNLYKTETNYEYFNMGKGKNYLTFTG